MARVPPGRKANVPALNSARLEPSSTCRSFAELRSESRSTPPAKAGGVPTPKVCSGRLRTTAGFCRASSSWDAAGRDCDCTVSGFLVALATFLAAAVDWVEEADHRSGRGHLQKLAHRHP